MVSAILDGRVLTRDQLVKEIVADKRFVSMERALRSGWGALLKPPASQGALCYGPNRGKAVTFTSPASLIPNWQPPPEPDEAAPAAIASYLSAYGPATPEAFDAWLTRSGHRKTTVESPHSIVGKESRRGRGERGRNEGDGDPSVQRPEDRGDAYQSDGGRGGLHRIRGNDECPDQRDGRETGFGDGDAVAFGDDNGHDQRHSGKASRQQGPPDVVLARPVHGEEEGSEAGRRQ